MFSRAIKYLKRISFQVNRIPEIEKLINSHIKSPKINMGQIQAQMNNQKQSINSLQEVEFQVFSQWGDDGIIQYLVNKIDIPNKTFIEFGVEDYTESNTRFLLLNNNWKGYVLDGSAENVRKIKEDKISWACELQAACAFIDKDNINQLIERAGFKKEVGILSVDIDGNDYWVWQAINCINPVIVITEYNSLFGKNTFWTLPYNPSFVRTLDDSISYYGASLQALNKLAVEKGYVFIGCNSKGNNAYFVRKDKIGTFIVPTTIEKGFVLSSFREAQVNGEWVSGNDKIKLLKGHDIYDLEKNKTIKIDPQVVAYNDSDLA